MHLTTTDHLSANVTEDGSPATIPAPCAAPVTAFILTLHQNGQYGVGNSSTSRTNAVVQTPFVFLVALCCTSPVYPITHMNDDLTR